MRRALRRAAILAGYVMGALLPTAPVSAQWVETGREPTVCPSPFRPISGITFRGWIGFSVTWVTAPGQLGAATYHGIPNPVVSTDGTRIWDDPEASATCEIIWYWAADHAEAVFDWHVVSYGGEIRNCAGPGKRPTDEVENSASVEDPSFDPYTQSDLDDGTCSPVPGIGGGSWSGPEGSTCSYQYIYIDISYDGGRTWRVYWEGWAAVCE